MSDENPAPSHFATGGPDALSVIRRSLVGKTFTLTLDVFDEDV
jgi:hypothetical protein